MLVKYLCVLGDIKVSSYLFPKNDNLKFFNMAELNYFCYMKFKFADVAADQLEFNLALFQYVMAENVFFLL